MRGTNSLARGPSERLKSVVTESPANVGAHSPKDENPGSWRPWASSINSDVHYLPLANYVPWGMSHTSS